MEEKIIVDRNDAENIIKDNLHTFRLSEIDTDKMRRYLLDQYDGQVFQTDIDIINYIDDMEEDLIEFIIDKME